MLKLLRISVMDRENPEEPALKMKFYQEIRRFVTQAGFACEETAVDGLMFLKTWNAAGETLYILPAAISARSPEEAAEEYRKRSAAGKLLQGAAMAGLPDKTGGNAGSCGRNYSQAGTCVVTIAEDRWRKQNSLYRARVLSHLGKFRSIFARNCSVERIDRGTANRFMDANHTYGASACRHCYGLTDRNSGMLVAAATFSNSRKWIKEGREIRSYEWIRYASASGTRIPGGMGKVLKKFMEDIRPDDIMSYADLEWSDGAVYRRLGFVEDGQKEPVLFTIDPEDWSRKAFRQGHGTPQTGQPARILQPEDFRTDGMLWYMNDGSLKYRLRLPARP